MSVELGQALEDAIRRSVLDAMRELRGELGTGTGPEKPATYEQAAAFAGCSKNTIQHWVTSGALPATGKGKLRRVLLSDVVKVLAAMRGAPAAVVPIAQPKSRALEILASTGAQVRRAR